MNYSICLAMKHALGYAHDGWLLWQASVRHSYPAVSRLYGTLSAAHWPSCMRHCFRAGCWTTFGMALSSKCGMMKAVANGNISFSIYWLYGRLNHSAACL